MFRNRMVYVLCGILILLFNSGCATPIRPINAVQSDCNNASNNNFELMVGCLRRALSVPPYTTSEGSDLAQLYSSYAEALIGKVRSNQLSVEDARYQLASLYSQLKNTELSRGYNSQASMNVFLQQLNNNINANTNKNNTFQPITCTKMGNTTRCY